MFERFTDRARRVVVLAQEEARMLKQNWIGTEHILMGLIHEGEGAAANTLESLGVSLEKVRELSVEISGSAKVSPSGHLPFTPRGKKALELSLRESLQLGHTYIGTEHILLGLIRDNMTGSDGNYISTAMRILGKLEVETSTVRQYVLQLVSEKAEDDIRSQTVAAEPAHVDERRQLEEDLEKVQQVLLPEAHAEVERLTDLRDSLALRLANFEQG